MEKGNKKKKKEKKKKRVICRMGRVLEGGVGICRGGGVGRGSGRGFLRSFLDMVV